MHILNALVTIVFCCLWIFSGSYSFIIYSLIAYFVFFNVGLEASLHRFFSHRSFVTSRSIEIFLSIVGTLCTIGSTITWSSIHRQHHKFSDTIDDPHSPSQNNKLFMLLSQFDKSKLSKISPFIVKDITKDPFQLFLHRHYFKIILFYCIVLMLINPVLVVMLYSIPSTLVLLAIGVINVFGHSNFAKPVKYRNNIWMFPFIYGEAWHSDHHLHPHKANFGEKWWMIDPTYLFIQMIKK
jgi:fatty-acid desaturase